MARQIEVDIEKWAKERLSLWFHDTVDRFEDADTSEVTTFTNTIAILIMATAKALVAMGISPQEAGYQVAKLMRELEREWKGIRKNG